GLAEAQNLLHPLAAIEHYQQARVYAQQANDLYMDGWIVQRVGITLLMLGRFDDIRAMAGDAYELVTKTHNWRDYTLMLSALTGVEAAVGAFDVAERYARDTLALVSRYRAAYGGIFVPFNLAYILALRGVWNAAATALDLVGERGGLFER